MPSITTAAALNQYIAELEIKKTDQEIELKQTIKETLDGLKPANLIKNAWNQISTSPEIKDNIIDNGIGLATGYLSKKILTGNTKNPIKRLLGSLAQYGITNMVANHPEPIKNLGSGLLKLIFRRKKQVTDPVSEK